MVVSTIIIELPAFYVQIIGYRKDPPLWKFKRSDAEISCWSGLHFSMFFGAGNLIFPPQLGAQAGVDTWFAMAGLAVSAVFLPLLGVIAVVRAGSLTELASRVHPAFATVFTVLIYLSIGPLPGHPQDGQHLV